MDISRILALGGSIRCILRGSEALGGSIVRALRVEEDQGGAVAEPCMAQQRVRVGLLQTDLHGRGGGGCGAGRLDMAGCRYL